MAGIVACQPAGPGVTLQDSWWVDGRQRAISAMRVIGGDPEAKKLPPVPPAIEAVLAACGKARKTPQMKLAVADPSLPGMDIPDAMIERLKGVPKEKQSEEGIKMCVETIQKLREIPGVRGIHIMAIEWEEKVSQIAKEAGLLPRPQL